MVSIVLTKTVESDNTKNERQTSTEKLEYELWQNLAAFMNTEVCYTIKKLLPADLKTLYIGQSDDELELFNRNPFADDFHCVPNTSKGGFYITENITYGCVIETDWSIKMADDIMTNLWECQNCSNSYYLSGVQKLQHIKGDMIKYRQSKDTHYRIHKY